MIALPTADELCLADAPPPDGDTCLACARSIGAASTPAYACRTCCAFERFCGACIISAGKGCAGRAHALSVFDVAKAVWTDYAPPITLHVHRGCAAAADGRR